jgi:hypothetical protein
MNEVRKTVSFLSLDMWIYVFMRVCVVLKNWKGVKDKRQRQVGRRPAKKLSGLCVCAAQSITHGNEAVVDLSGFQVGFRYFLLVRRSGKLFVRGRMQRPDD